MEWDRAELVEGKKRMGGDYYYNILHMVLRPQRAPAQPGGLKAAAQQHRGIFYILLTTDDVYDLNHTSIQNSRRLKFYFISKSSSYLTRPHLLAWFFSNRLK